LGLNEGFAEGGGGVLEAGELLRFCRASVWAKTSKLKGSLIFNRSHPMRCCSPLLFQSGALTEEQVTQLREG
jgi:hypothetical protein